jgi:hypothetical protein
LRRTYRLKYVFEEKVERRIEIMGTRERRHKPLLDVFKENKGYWRLKEDATGRNLLRSGLGKGYEHVVRQTAE